MDGVGIPYRRLGAAIFAVLFAPVAASADSVNNEWNSTTRAQSMGNTGVASASDAVSAMFYNPAALARSKKVSAEFFSPQVEISTGALGRTDRHVSLEKAKAELQKKPAKTSSVGGSLYPNIHAQNFNFGVLMSGQGSSYLDGNTLHYRSRYLVMPTLGISIGLLGGRWKLGFAARAIQLTANDRSAPVTQAGTGYTIDADEGFGVGLDAGTLLTLPMAGLPTIGFVARNVGDTSFGGGGLVKVASGSVNRPDKLKMTYDGGIAFFPKLGRKSTLTFAADYRDILNVTDTATMRRVNLGLEFSASDIFFFRAGVSRGYWTAGLGLASRYGSLDLGSYGEELDAKGFRKKEDRRISIRIGRKF